MTGSPSASGREPFVSTGSLPAPQTVDHLVWRAYELSRGCRDGAPSKVYPALEQADVDLFGICLLEVDGTAHIAGDADHSFTIMSVAKPFTFALVGRTLGVRSARRLIGANATGLRFNAVEAIERSTDGRTNPMVNPGAIASASWIAGKAEEKWDILLGGLSAFAGRSLELDEEVYACASATNHVNRSAAWLLHARGLLGCDPDLALDLYTRQSCLRVTARDLAVMGATLADGGVNPVTGEQPITPELCHAVLAVMLTAGMYEESGDWLYEVGQPAKSGIAGGVMTVSPGKGGLGVFSPPLDSAGNSVRGGQVARFLSQELGLDLLNSIPLISPE